MGELCERFEISQPAIARHLRSLRDGGLVASPTDAQRRIYSLTPKPLHEIELWLDRNQKFWQKRLDALDTLLVSRQKPRKTRRGKK
ncbi:MAG TPA: transcriptional regulator [Myxococcales bacterium]|nr:transcriptional regulator [Myxococcales bacterium]HIK83654.1 transcriptional regulator [Myxococcales bacterium]